MKLLYILLPALFLQINNLSAQVYYPENENIIEHMDPIHNKLTVKDNSYFNISYSYAIPISSDFKSYINENSNNGLSIDYQYFITDNISVGTSLGFHSFREKHENIVVDTEDGFYEGTQFRNITTIPILGKVRYNITSNKSMTYFTGFGAGIAMTKQDMEVSKYISTTSNNNFIIQAEIGAIFKIHDQMYINTNLNYNNIFKGISNNNLGYLGINIGLTI